MCQKIKFDDEELGGFMSTSEDGNPILQFDDDDRERTFDLDFWCEDVLPDLPRLKGSAEAGCDFCKFLRNAIIRTEFEHKEETGAVEMNLYYVWGVDRSHNGTWRGKHGLNGLVVSIVGRCPRSKNSGGNKTLDPITLSFIICSDDDPT